MLKVAWSITWIGDLARSRSTEKASRNIGSSNAREEANVFIIGIEGGTSTDAVALGSISTQTFAPKIYPGLPASLSSEFDSRLLKYKRPVATASDTLCIESKATWGGHTYRLTSDPLGGSTSSS